MAEAPEVTVLGVSGTKLVEKYADQLKKRGEITLPPWVDYVKTSHSREATPREQDWFFTRCASIARKLYLNPHKGINWLCHKYMSRKNRGSNPEHVFTASRSVIRRCLKELESIGVVRKHKRRGRSLTAKGRQELDECAKAVFEELEA